MGDALCSESGSEVVCRRGGCVRGAEGSSTSWRLPAAGPVPEFLRPTSAFPEQLLQEPGRELVRWPRFLQEQQPGPVLAGEVREERLREQIQHLSWQHPAFGRVPVGRAFSHQPVPRQLWQHPADGPVPVEKEVCRFRLLRLWQLLGPGPFPGGSSPPLQRVWPVQRHPRPGQLWRVSRQLSFSSGAADRQLADTMGRCRTNRYRPDRQTERERDRSY